MVYVKIGDQQIEAAISGSLQDRNWGGRDSKTIRCAMTCEEAKNLFHDDVEWSIVYYPKAYVDENGQAVTPEPEIYDNSDYCIAGDITDHRDGTVSVKMGKITDAEALAELKEALDL